MWWKQAVFAVFIISMTSPAIAQIAAPPNYWAHGTELGVTVGTAQSSSETNRMVAARVGWDASRWVGIDGQGRWFDRGDRESDFAFDIAGVFNLVARRNATPFVGVGVGFYRASFDGGDLGTIPDFYRQRMDGGSVTNVFTDPAFTVTGGVDLLVRRRWLIRPEVSMLFVRANGTGNNVLTAGVSFGYRFEDHSVSPAYTMNASISK